MRFGNVTYLERIPKTPRLHPIRLDLADRLSIGRRIQVRAGRSGLLSTFLINNAGAGHFDAAEFLPVETVASQFQILVFGQIQLMQLALRHMQGRGEGLVINVTSLASRLPVPFHGGLQRREAALASFTMSIQLELGNSPVHVVDLQPAGHQHGI